MTAAGQNVKRLPILCASAAAVCIAGATLALAGCSLGVCEVIGPQATAMSLVLSVASAVLWLFVGAWVALRRSLPRRWLWVLTGTAVCWGGIALAGYVLIWVPYHKMQNLDWWSTAPSKEARRVCHRSMIWNVEPHDQFICLAGCGDESSVPYVIWALRRMPIADHGGDCTWRHGLDALREITNHSVGGTREAWSRWYGANKDRTQREWWVDGFVAEGYSVTLTGGDASFRSLLRALGRTPWCRLDDKFWLTRNAVRMLALTDEKTITRVAQGLVHHGSMEERCGVAWWTWYAEKLPRAYAEPILRELAQDRRRPVRLCASGILSRKQLEWYDNRSGFVEKRLKPRACSDDAFFAPPGAKVAAVRVGKRLETYRPAIVERRSRIEAVAADGRGDNARPSCVIRIDWPLDPSRTVSENVAVITIEGVSPAGKQPVYSRRLVETLPINARELRWLYDAADDSVYVSAPDFTCKIERKSGQAIWEMGFGTGNCDDLAVVDGYLIINKGGELVLCDAARGGILAKYGPPACRLFENRISIVDGRLRAKDYDGALYVLKLPAAEEHAEKK